MPTERTEQSPTPSDSKRGQQAGKFFEVLSPYIQPDELAYIERTINSDPQIASLFRGRIQRSLAALDRIPADLPAQLANRQRQFLFGPLTAYARSMAQAVELKRGLDTRQ